MDRRTLALQQANQDLEAFAYSALHDLRAPLRAIQGFANAPLEDYGHQLDHTGQDYAKRLVNAVQHLDTLIRDLLAFGRLGRAEVALQPVNVEQVVTEAIRQLEQDIAAHHAVITVGRPLGVVIGYMPILVQVVVNLLSNAMKFLPTDRQPVVQVRSEEREGSVRLYVKDNGIGVAPQHQARIFRVFERLHGEEQYPGTGIGLAVVRRGIERLGGRGGVISEVGQGSQFWIELPKAEGGS